MQSMEGKYLYIMYLPNGLFQNVGVVRYQTVSSLSKKFWRSYSKLVLEIAYLKKIHYSFHGFSFGLVQFDMNDME